MINFLIIEMERIRVNGVLPQPNQNQELSEELRITVQRCMRLLYHSSTCRNCNCNYLGCCKMKRVLRHTRMCKRKLSAGCFICKRVAALCCCHAQDCQEVRCPVPFCSSIKIKQRHRFNQQLRSQLWLQKGKNMGG